MTAINRVPRTRGALSGALLVVLGLWAALAPFVGPSADFGYTPGGDTWIWTDGRGVFSVLPGAVTVVGALLLVVSASRVIAAFGAGLAVVAGAWLVVGPTLSPLWNGPGIGTPLGSGDRQIAEQLTFFTGAGVLIVYLAAMALGRLAVVGVRETNLAERHAEAAQAHRDRDLQRDDLHRDDLHRDDVPEPTRPMEPVRDTEPFRDTEPEPGPHDEYNGRPDASVPQGRYALDRPVHADQKVAGARNTRPDI
ncbi:hypothetical protein [Actinocorallia longicatena]|uniref:Tryptophan-associated transmembrane protein (Trp_oprn_chp) n=1 Tax=Actinocorallia longicatena TaxID=111803 RepID=A0ABP6QDP2_9ACTN